MEGQVTDGLVLSESGPFKIGAKRIEGAPVVAIRVWLRGGSRLEQTPGQAMVTGRLLGEGTARRDWRRLAEDVESKGMVLSSYGTLEAHGLSFDALARDLPLALDWTGELLRESTFPAPRCDWIRTQLKVELESLADLPDVLSGWAFLKQLYEPHPAARVPLGSAEALDRLEPHECAAFHDESMKRGGVVVVAGDVDPDHASRSLSEIFKDLGTGASDQTPEAPVGLGPRQQVPTGVEDQVHLYLGHLTLDRRHRDLPALEVAGVILGAGGGLSGRIPWRLREKSGLAYSADAATVTAAGLDPGRLVIYVGTAPETAERAEALAREELRRFVDEGPTREEVDDAKSFLLGREPFRRETARQWADLVAEGLFYTLPVYEKDWRQRRLAALDRNEVLAAVRRHLSPERLKVTWGVGLSQRVIEPAVRHLGLA